MTQVYKARYFSANFTSECQSWLQPELHMAKHFASQDLIRQHRRLRIGDVSGVFVTKDPWLPVEGSGLINTSLGEAFDDATFNQLMETGERKWDEHLIKDVFNGRDSEHILHIPFTSRSHKDVWYRKMERKGSYTVRSGYRL